VAVGAVGVITGVAPQPAGGVRGGPEVRLTRAGGRLVPCHHLEAGVVHRAAIGGLVGAGVAVLVAPQAVGVILWWGRG
jgi:hypothetical protein